MIRLFDSLPKPTASFQPRTLTTGPGSKARAPFVFPPRLVTAKVLSEVLRQFRHSTAGQQVAY